MSARCLLCGASCPRRFVIRGHALHRCADCDFEFVWPTPSAAVIAEVYRAGYFTGPGAGYEDYFARERAQAARKAAVRLDRLAALGLTTGRALDVGCAAGYFVEAARDRGFDAWGFEVSPEARAEVAAALRDRIVSSLIEAPGDFDLLTLWDVLEHLPDPDASLRTLLPRLRPNGFVGIVVPVLGSLNTRIAPRTWDQYKPPEHLWYFSARALHALLARHGLAVVHAEPAWSRRTRFIDPEERRRDLPTRALRTFDRAFTAVVSAIGGAHLRIDSMAFYARRCAP